MAGLLKYPSVVISRQLPVPANVDVGALISAPPDAAVFIEGFILGTAGEFGYLAYIAAPFQAAPKSTSFPFYSTAMTVPAGERFHWWLAPNENLFAAGSVASTTQQVWATMTAYFMEPEEVFGGGVGPGGVGSKFRGPTPHFMKGG